MINLRLSNERGVTQTEWLQSWHTFSFGDYHDAQHNRFHILRVINQDIVQPGKGFAAHSHSDMEIMTYVIKGTIVHKDNLGNETLIRPGEIQRMSAGTGVMHSEYNYSDKDLLELLQIWIFPDRKGLSPSYQQVKFDTGQTGLQLLASSENGEGVLLIHQQVKIYRGYLLAQETLKYPILSQRHLWLQMISGQLLLNYHLLSPGDGAAITGESLLKFKANADSEFLLFDLE